MDPTRSTPARPPTGPVQPSERIEELDLLRGLAVLGILVVNARYFDLSFAYGVPTNGDGPADTLTAWLVSFLAEGKFYSLFALLFGYGAGVQWSRAEARGERPTPRYLRRMAVLLLLGVLHAVLVWPGDVLASYAVVGTVLLLFRRSPPRRLLGWAAALLAVLAVPLLGATLAAGLDPTAAAGSPDPGQIAAEERVRVTGSYGEVTAVRATEDLPLAAGTALLLAPSTLALFLLGLYAARRERLAAGARHRLRAVLVWGLALGVPVAAAQATAAAIDPASAAAAAAYVLSVGFGAPALALAYAAGLVLLVRRNVTWRRRLGFLAPVGRLALTNYLTQSVVLGLVFYGYGLGLWGRVDPLPALLLALGVFALQVAFSRWWLARFAFGPVEWILRTATYLRRPPVRVRALSECR